MYVKLLYGPKEQSFRVGPYLVFIVIVLLSDSFLIIDINLQC